jgi:hypothetical protein
MQNLIDNHNRLCKRFTDARAYFNNPSVPVQDKISQEENIAKLCKELRASIKAIQEAGYDITDDEMIDGIQKTV